MLIDTDEDDDNNVFYDEDDVNNEYDTDSSRE